MKTHAIIPIFIPHKGCPNDCVFCNQKAITARGADVSPEDTRKIIETYLPKQMSAEELEEALKAIIAEVGAEGPKDMGKVMGAATKKLAGLAEGRAISAKVKELLG